MGRRRHLRAAGRGRQPPAARPRYLVAHHRRSVDARQSRGAAHRYLFLYHARPPLDFDAVGVGDALRRNLCAVRLERAGGADRRGGPVVLTAAGSALTFALLAKFLSRHLSQSATILFVAAALALTAQHLLARPHVLALPVMVAWVGGLMDAADRRDAPSFWLLPLLALWANLHGGFILGLMLVGPIALDAVVGADAASRKSLALRWAVFGVGAVIAA